MKKILGLDLGTTSIGWALVNEKENDNEKSEMQPAICFKGSERSGESFSRNHVEDRRLSAHFYSQRRVGDGISNHNLKGKEYDYEHLEP